MKNEFLEIAKTIGLPIDSIQKIPKVMEMICDIETAEFGEDVYVFTTYQNNPDIIYTATDSGELESIHVNPVTGANLEFIGLQSDLFYVTIQELQDAKDQTALARKKAHITRSMDKLVTKRLLDVILGITAQEVELGSNDDIYSGILKMIQKISDYGDNYVLLVDSSIYNKIMDFDRNNVGTFNYRLGIMEMLSQYKVDLVKVFGEVALDNISTSAPVLATGKAIMVARDSTLIKGKPCIFVRRLISGEVASQLGIPANEAQRLICNVGGCQVINAGKNILGWGVVGYECNIEAVINPLAICWCEELALPA